VGPAGGTPGCPVTEQLVVEVGGTATVTAAFADRGMVADQVVDLDWGDDAIPDTVIGGPDGLPFAGPGTVVATTTYGDNGTFPVTLTVRDDDTGVGTASASVMVTNVDPTTVVAEPVAAVGGDGGTVLADGPDDDGVLDTPTFVTRGTAVVAMSARATDPGSDDLTFLWDWDASNRFDTTQTTNTSLVNPPGTDALPSPSVQPRDVTDSQSHSWAQPCLYRVGVLATDDDWGMDQDDTFVVVRGTETRIWGSGWWYNQYESSKKNANTMSTATRSCYLEVVRHMSRVFNTHRSMNTFAEAKDVLNTKQTADDRQIMVRQLLASWLNFANGSVGWFDLVDTDGDRVGDRPFHEVITQSETLRLDGAATRAQLLAQETVLKRVNGD
jgi:hypothetical protein